MAKLVLTFEERVLGEYPVDAESETTIGRLPDNTVVIDNPAVSGHHARIFVDGADYILEDLRSKNGTYVNEKHVVRRALCDGDMLLIGNHRLVFEVMTIAEPARSSVGSVCAGAATGSARIGESVARATTTSTNILVTGVLLIAAAAVAARHENPSKADATSPRRCEMRGITRNCRIPAARGLDRQRGDSYMKVVSLCQGFELGHCPITQTKSGQQGGVTWRYSAPSRRRVVHERRTAAAPVSISR
jgi:hypothetical protein